MDIAAMWLIVQEGERDGPKQRAQETERWSAGVRVSTLDVYYDLKPRSSFTNVPSYHLVLVDDGGGSGAGEKIF